MELALVLLAGAAAFAGLSICRAHWFRLADVMYRLGPERLRAIGWPVAHPFSQIDPNADGQDGALGVFPQRATRMRVLLRGLPDVDLPDHALGHARRYRSWGLAIASLITLCAAVAHPFALALVALCGFLCWMVVPGWTNTADRTTEDLS